MRPSKTTGCFSADLMASKSGVRNSFHSVTTTSASAPSSASAGLAAKCSPGVPARVGVELSAENRRQLWIPEGFAHGFLALHDETQFLYKTTDVYARDCERGIRWDDPAIGIDWPLPPGLAAPAVAPKDAAAPLLAAADL